MSDAIPLVLALAVVSGLGLRFSARAARAVSVQHLPSRYRRRLTWWRDRAGPAQLVCLVVVVGLTLGLAVRFGSAPG